MKYQAIFCFLAVLLAVGLAGQMVGGPRDVDVNDAGVQDALNFAVSEHNKGRNDMYDSKVKEVIRVQRQIVSGSKYIFNVTMAKSNCRKGQMDGCAIHQDPAAARPYSCIFTVWSQPWLESMRLIKQEC